MPEKPKGTKPKSSRARRVGKAILGELAEQKKRIDALEARRAAEKPKPRARSVFEELFGDDEEE